MKRAEPMNTTSEICTKTTGDEMEQHAYRKTKASRYLYISGK